MQYHNSGCIIWVTKKLSICAVSSASVWHWSISSHGFHYQQQSTRKKSSNSLFHVIFQELLNEFSLRFLFKLWPRAQVPWPFALRLWWYHKFSSNTNSCYHKCTAASLDLLPTWQTEGASGHHGGQSSASLISECLLLSGICTQDLCKNCFLILNGSLSLTFRVFYTMWAVSNSLLCLQQAHWPDGNPTRAVPSSSLMPPAQCFSPTWDVFQHE